MMISTDGKMKVELSGLSGEVLELGQTVVVKGGNVETTGTVVSLTRVARRRRSRSAATNTIWTSP